MGNIVSIHTPCSILHVFTYLQIFFFSSFPLLIYIYIFIFYNLVHKLGNIKMALSYTWKSYDYHLDTIFDLELDTEAYEALGMPLFENKGTCIFICMKNSFAIC